MSGEEHHPDIVWIRDHVTPVFDRQQMPSSLRI